MLYTTHSARCGRTPRGATQQTPAVSRSRGGAVQRSNIRFIVYDLVLHRMLECFVLHLRAAADLICVTNLSSCGTNDFPQCTH